MSLFVKICGITSEAAALTAAEWGADAVGFVFAESPRRVDPARAGALAGELPAGMLRVAVFRRPSAAEIIDVLGEFDADVVQADYQSLVGFGHLDLLPVYREPVTTQPIQPRFLYEGERSGIGARVDLEEAARLARGSEMVLAGGLDPGNVGEVITAVKPYGVDVSSGVETSPGVKSPDLIRSFIAAARSAAERLVTT